MDENDTFDDPGGEEAMDSPDEFEEEEEMEGNDDDEANAGVTSGAEFLEETSEQVINSKAVPKWQRYN